MANLALDAFQGFAQHSFISNEKTWVALSLNKSGRNEGKYDFNGTDFVLQGSAFAGIIDGDNYWLISTLSSGSANPKAGVFEFKVWKNGEGGAKGSFDKAASDALCLQWQKDGCNAAINCNDIPVLKTFVKVLHELKIIVTNESREITVRLNIDDAQCPDIESALSAFWAYLIGNEGNTPEEGTEAYSAAMLINDAGLMSLPAMSVEMLPNVPLKNVMGKITGHKIECFPFVGDPCPYDSLTVTLPKKEEKKKSSGGWGSNTGGVVDPKAALEARQAFVIKAFNDAQLCTNAVTLKDVFDTGMAGKEGKEYLEFITKVMGR